MSEFPLSKKPVGFSCVVSHFLHFFFFLLSHPLYFSYFVFFSPYLLKLLSFLSPLFLTTFLLFSVFVTLVAFSSSSDRHSMGLLATTYHIVFDGSAEEIEESRPVEELEAYKIVFETYTFGIGTEENPYDGGDVPEVEVEVDCEESVVHFPEEIKIFPENEKLGQNEAKAEEEREKENEEKVEEKEIEVIKDLRKQLTEEDSSISSRSESSPWSSPREYSSLGSYGSMRKEKEWRRTLACKLFEERHNAEGSEGMDSLWETYEKSESKKLQKKQSSKGKRGKKFQEEDEEEEDGDEGQLCCLQALKFSAGKMNLGMGRPNLVKMSRALKGFGWLNLNRRGSRKGLIH